jgi:hypothetical protein
MLFFGAEKIKPLFLFNIFIPQFTLPQGRIKKLKEATSYVYKTGNSLF